MKLRLLGAALLWLGFSSGTPAARLPEWAQPFADAAPEIEEISEDYARVLFKETSIAVRPDGRWTVRVRRAVQALRADAEHIGLGLAPASRRREIVTSRAWHVPPEGKTKRTRAGSAIDLTLSGSFLTDAKTRVLPVEGIERGSLVFFEFETEEDPWELVYPVVFADDGPALRMRVAVSVPPGWKVRHAWLSGDGPEPADEHGTTVWELGPLPAPESDALAPSPLEHVPRLLLAFRPPAGTTLAVQSFERWTEIASWFERLSSERGDATSEVQSRAAEVWGQDDDRLGGVLRTAAWVRDRVRYVAVELGIEGYRPRPVGDVLVNLYGDCKDKATLLRALLAARGIESYPVLVNLTTKGTVSDELPALSAFNHLILAVPVEQVPEGIAPAVVDAGELGRLLFLDPTDESTAAGQLSAGISGKKALVVAGERSALVRLPSDPRGHRVDRVMTAEIGADGSTTARIETTLYGEPAGRWRRLYRASSKDYEEEVHREVSRRWTGGALKSLEVTDEADDGAFVEIVDVEIARPAIAANQVLFEVFPDALASLPQVSLSRRRVPVEYPYPLTLTYESRIKGAPPGWGTPEVEQRDGEGWSARGEIAEQSGEIVGDFEFVLERLTFSPEEFRDLRLIWAGARKASGAKIDLSGVR